MSLGFKKEQIVTNIAWFCYDNPNNLGDVMCFPAAYVNPIGEQLNVGAPVNKTHSRGVIFGGGGLFNGAELVEKTGDFAMVTGWEIERSGANEA